MVISRNAFFVLMLFIVISPFLIPKIIWLANSERVNGTMRFVGKAYTGQLIHFYSVISFPVKGDTEWFNSNDNTIYDVGDNVPVRFQKNNPADAKVNIFSNIWSDTVVYGSGPLLIILMIFLHPRGIPQRSKLYVSRNKPFIQLR